MKSFGVSSADNITFAPQISFTEKFFAFNEESAAARAKALARRNDNVKTKNGGLKWTRTIDLPLIRRTL